MTHHDVVIRVSMARGFKCARCWFVREEVGLHLAHPHLCIRCIGVVTGETPDIHDLAARAFDLAFQEALAIGVPREEAVRRAGAINRLGPLARLPMGEWHAAGT